MKKTKMVLMDSDETYLSSLYNYFMENAPQFELYIFTQEDKLIRYLENGGEAEVVVVDEKNITARLKELAEEATRIALSIGMTEENGFVPIKKYQKSETLLNEILLKHAENKGNAQVIVGKSITKVAAFYSPAGGSGKTVLSLAASVAAVQMGKKVLYLNLEEIDSVKDILGRTPGTLSEVYLAIKAKGMKVGVKLAASAGQIQNGGFCYLSGVDSISEYEEVDGEDIKRLIEGIRGLADYDLALLDLSSGFSEKTKKTLECADRILMPVLSEENSIAKIKRLLGEEELHDRYQLIFEKTNLIINKVGTEGIGADLQASGLLEKLPCCAMIAASPIFQSYRQIFACSSLLRQSMEPIVQSVLSHRQGEGDGR